MVGDRGVVVDEVALCVPLLRPEHLGCVGRVRRTGIENFRRRRRVLVKVEFRDVVEIEVFESLEHRMTKCARVGHFLETHRALKGRAHPHRVRTLLRRTENARLRGCILIQALTKLCEHRLAESGSDVPGVGQCTVAKGPKMERTDAR